MPERDRPVARTDVSIPADYFQLDDEDAAPLDEAIADVLMAQLGIEDEE